MTRTIFIENLMRYYQPPIFKKHKELGGPYPVNLVRPTTETKACVKKSDRIVGGIP